MGTVYSKGELVPTEGTYVCVPCGFHHHYQANESFGECTSCLAGKTTDESELADGSGLWEPAAKSTHTEIASSN
jgi:hypothetical protein